MLSVDEHPGILAFLVGIIVLVMAAIGLSLIVDRRLKFSACVANIEREVDIDAVELERVRVNHHKRLIILAESRVLEAGPIIQQEVLEKLEVLQLQGNLLKKRCCELKNQISTTEMEFSFYRADYRRKTWLAAVGENLGHLKARNGRGYKQATIVRVTDVGLEIRHEDGIARIQAPDLDSRLQDRFQWKDEERRKVLEKERDHLEGKPAKPGVSDS